MHQWSRLTRRHSPRILVRWGQSEGGAFTSDQQSIHWSQEIYRLVRLRFRSRHTVVRSISSAHSLGGSSQAYRSLEESPSITEQNSNWFLSGASLFPHHQVIDMPPKLD